MPSAASFKQQQQANADSSAESPTRQAFKLLEHKIRNLEKRKSKLESYRDLQKSGKDLTADQKVAVSKYDEVNQTLEFARDISKQFQQIATVFEKDQKKVLRKEALVRAQTETAKIREVLIIQNTLSCFADATVREDFLTGTNGACKIDSTDLEVLDQLMKEISLNRIVEQDDPLFSESAQKAAEHLSLVVDGKQKSFATVTYERIKSIVQEINDSGYFDKSSNVEIVETEPSVIAEDGSKTSESEEVKSEQNGDASSALNSARDSENVTPVDGIVKPAKSIVNQNFVEAPSAASVPAPVFASQLRMNVPGVQPIPPNHPVPMMVQTGQPADRTVPNGTIVLMPQVQSVEHGYFKQHSNIYIQPMRPLAEVIGTGNFSFLQDSEIDSPDVTTNNLQQNSTQSQVIQNQSIPIQPASPNIQQQQQQQQQPQQQSQPKQSNAPAQIIPSQSPAATLNVDNTQLPSQQFTNQTFPLYNSVNQNQIYNAGLKVTEPHSITAFTNSPAAGPLPLLQQHQQQSQGPANSSQPQITANSTVTVTPPAALVNHMLGSASVPGFPTGKFTAQVVPGNTVTAIHANQSPSPVALQAPQPTPTEALIVKESTSIEHTVVEEPQRYTWNVNQEVKDLNSLTTTGTETAPTIDQWNGGTFSNEQPPEINTWSNSQAAQPSQGGQGQTGRYHGHYNKSRTGGGNYMNGSNGMRPGGLRNSRGMPSTNGSNGMGTNNLGHRNSGNGNRPSNSYQSNRNGNSGSGGTFFRNNEPFNQNGGFNGNKLDNGGGYRNSNNGGGNYRSRDNHMRGSGNRNGNGNNSGDRMQHRSMNVNRNMTGTGGGIGSSNNRMGGKQSYGSTSPQSSHRSNGGGNTNSIRTQQTVSG